MFLRHLLPDMLRAIAAAAHAEVPAKRIPDLACKPNARQLRNRLSEDCVPEWEVLWGSRRIPWDVVSTLLVCLCTRRCSTPIPPSYGQLPETA